MSTVRKELTQDQDEYVISYISLGHLNHCFLGISKKVNGKYYLVKTIGVMQVNPYTQAKHDEFAVRVFKIIPEPIYPTKDKASAYAKHYAIDEQTALNTLGYLNNKFDEEVSFDTFNHNCHNFVLAILENSGFHDDQLFSHRLPCKAEKLLCQMSRVEIPNELRESSNNTKYSFFQKENAKNETTWEWDNVEIENELIYTPNEAYFDIIAATPGLNGPDLKDEDKKLKQAIHLLRDYENGSFFWHPCRTYRAQVKQFLDGFEKKQKEEKTISNLISGLRKVIANYHRTNDVANAKGSLHRRITFIDFVLNNSSFTFQDQLTRKEQIKKEKQQEQDKILKRDVHFASGRFHF